MNTVIDQEMINHNYPQARVITIRPFLPFLRDPTTRDAAARELEKALADLAGNRYVVSVDVEGDNGRFRWRVEHDFITGYPSTLDITLL